MRKSFQGFIGTALLAASLGTSALAAEDGLVEVRREPALLSADEMTYDRELGTVSAVGAVEITQGARMLRADRVTYNERSDTVIATGNVILLEPSGDVLFAEHVELTDEMKNGFIRDIRIVFSDQSRLAALGGRRYNDNVTEIDKAVYTACESCATDPDRPPLWQIKAVKVIHNREKQRVEYKDATLEFFGVPVAYTPYFAHPDPTVKRKTGFLVPNFGSSSSLGTKARVPFHYVIAPDKDFTFSPLLTSQESVVLAGEYRQRILSGTYKIDASTVYVEDRDSLGNATGNDQFRGHVKGDGLFQLDDVWRWGFNVFAASDDTYLQRYEFSTEDSLTSRLYTEGFRGRNYAAVNAFAFQGLKAEDDTSTTPFVLPLAEYSYSGEPDAYGARLGLDANLLALGRTAGTDSRRVYVNGNWQLPYTAPAGDRYKLTAGLRGDLYWTDDVVLDEGTPSERLTSDVTGRIIPQLAFDWNYPFVRAAGTTRQTIEPIAQVVWTPNGVNDEIIPNEDSQSFEFDDTNLFSLDRFPGQDLVEDGLRMNYGVKFGVYGQGGGYSTLLVGQSLRAHDSSPFGVNSGLDNQYSDYVAKLDIRPSYNFAYTQRVRLERDDLGLARNEIYIQAGPADYNVKIGYVSLADTADNLGFADREEINAYGRSKLTKFWHVFGGYRRDLQTDASLYGEIGLNYLDECFDFSVSFERSFTRDRELEPSRSINFKIKLLPFG